MRKNRGNGSAPNLSGDATETVVANEWQREASLGASIWRSRGVGCRNGSRANGVSGPDIHDIARTG